MSVMSTDAQPAVGSDCSIAHHLISVDVGRLVVEADALVLDPYRLTASGSFDKYCMVWSGFRNMPEDFKDMNQVTRRGVGWRYSVPDGTSSGAQSTIEFSDGGCGCVAVERLGPNWRCGYIWVAHATICGARAQTIVQGDIDTVFNAPQTRIYDANGNLRSPG
jgi:hypothetical protein